MSTAILVDAAFFLKRLRQVYPKVDGHDPKQVVKTLYTMCMAHVEDTELYRILVYDCPPLNKKSHHPITGNAVDFSKLPGAQFRTGFHDELKRQRKVALRLGYLRGHEWVIKPRATKELLNNKVFPSSLTRDDVKLDIDQKGVDMKIGIDITSLALKRMVKQIVLISGDGDFVPAAKLARREGIDVILDPMWSHIGDALHEHIDGLHSTSPKPASSS